MNFLGQGISSIIGSPIYYIAQMTTNKNIMSPSIMHGTTKLKKVCEFYDIDFDEFTSFAQCGHTCIIPHDMLQLPSLLNSFESTFTIAFYKESV